MKRIIYTLALLLSISLSAHADAYRDSLSVVLLSDVDSASLAKFETQLLEQLASLHQEQTAEMLSDFMHSQECRDVIIDIFEPYCRLYVSQSDLDEILVWFRSSAIAQGKFDFDHEKIGKDKKLSQCSKKSADNLQAFINRGKKGNYIAVGRYDAPTDYRRLFNVVLHNNAEMTDILNQFYLDSLVSKTPLTEEDRNRMVIREFVSELSNESLLAYFYNTFSQQELQLFTDGLRSQPYRKYEYACQKAKDQNGLKSLQLLGALSAYLMRYKPEIAKQFNDVFISSK